MVDFIAEMFCNPYCRDNTAMELYKVRSKNREHHYFFRFPSQSIVTSSKMMVKVREVLNKYSTYYIK